MLYNDFVTLSAFKAWVEKDNDLKMKKEPYNATFENEYLGTIEYIQIVLDKPFDMSLISDYINKSTPRFLNISFTSETLPFVSV